jgi:hypothetical protein
MQQAGRWCHEYASVSAFREEEVQLTLLWVRLDPRKGERKSWLKITSADASGMLYGNVNITPDGKSYAYRFRRILTNLYVATGLR